MIRFSRRALYKWGILLSTAVFLAACGSSSDGTTGLEKGKKVLRATFGGYFTSLNPQNMRGTWDSHAMQGIFDTLFIHALDGKVIPSLAKSYTITNGGKTYTFHLQPKATWSNGDPVKASDFVFAFQHLIDPKSAIPYAFLLSGVENAQDIMKQKKPVSTLGARAIDDKTLQVQLKSPLPYFTDLLTHPVTGAIPEKVVKKYGDKWAHPDHIVTNGAFLLKEYVPKDHLTLVKNPNFWGAKDVDLDKIVFYPIEDSTTALRRYKAGDLDLISASIPTKALNDLKKNHPDELTIHPRLGFEYYSMNSKNKKFDNHDVRKALALAINRKEITSKILEGMGVPALGLVFLRGSTAIRREPCIKASREQPINNALQEQKN